MPKFVIERTIPGAGRMTPDELRQASKNSAAAMRELGNQIHWITSYVTDDKLYCVFVAPSEELVAEHARRGRIPAERISRVVATVDASTGEGL